ncbi:hypothetical protein AB6A40_002897 [Gnathostoma spinigerum]|uniref:Transcriptional adapter 2-alpha/beta-like domain-containing protein n=1 Tax=Gnathostoma spinigerum TaxID=75299 RepID=A0ABD6E829_9BILA
MNLLSRFSQRFTRSMKHSQKTGHVKAEDHNCRSFRSSYRTNDYISNANVEWKDDEDEYASSNSSEIGVPTVSKSSRLKRKRRLVACHDPYSYGMQTSEEEEGGGCSISISLSPGANGDGHLDEILAKDVNANLKKFSLSKNIHLCEATPTTMYRELIILFDENDEKYLRNMQPEQFFAGSLPDTLPLHKIKKLRKDDMEVLCYLPKRDEFELESNNHAERLISRLNYESFGELDEEDEKLLHDVKLAKFLRYTRIIQGRRATHAVINEHEIIARYIDTKIKKTSEKSRGFNYPPQYYAMLRRQERFRNILTKAHQCLLQSELQQLQELLIENESLNDRIRELERLQNDGVTILKPSQKLGPEYLRARRKKKTFRTGGTSEQKKATQLWNRYKRWTHNQRLNEIPCSDTEGKAEC